MRAGSLSNATVINLLNRYYVPVYISNEDYTEAGKATPEEKRELRRIFQEGYAAKMSVGTVHVYLLNPQGHLIATMHVAQAWKPDALIPMLQQAVQQLGTPPGDPVIKPTLQGPPQCDPDSLLLHLTARYLQRKGDDYALIEGGSDWSAFPSEDWISLRREEWTQLLPPAGARIGRSWEIDPKLVSTLLLHFYPPTENWDLATNQIDEQSLTATVISNDGSRVRVKLTGHFKMKHPFYHKDDDRFVEASIYGFVEADPVKNRIRSLEIVTDQADYRGSGSDLPYGVAVSSMPATKSSDQ